MESQIERFESLENGLIHDESHVELNIFWIMCRQDQVRGNRIEIRCQKKRQITRLTRAEIRENSMECFPLRRMHAMFNFVCFQFSVSDSMEYACMPSNFGLPSRFSLVTGILSPPGFRTCVFTSRNSSTETCVKSGSDYDLINAESCSCHIVIPISTWNASSLHGVSPFLIFLAFSRWFFFNHDFPFGAHLIRISLELKHVSKWFHPS